MPIRNTIPFSLLAALPVIHLLAACGDGIHLTSLTGVTDSGGNDTSETSGASAPTSTMASTSELPTTSELTTNPSSATDTSSTSGDAMSTTGPVSAGESTVGAETAMPECGNAVQEAGEECDNGPANADNLECTANCTVNVCGDGLHWQDVEACDGGGESPLCDADCTLAKCGDGTVNQASGEACDDTNIVPLDGCENDCQTTELVGIFSGTTSEHTCLLIEDGLLKCWGYNSRGQLGYGHTNHIGDDEHASAAGIVEVGGKVVKVALGQSHTCAILEGGAVRCWGYGAKGRLGTGNTGGATCLDAQQKFKCSVDPVCCIGDDEVPSAIAPIEVGGKAADIVVGNSHTCVMLESGTVRCWGDNYLGQLGYGAAAIIGDNEKPVKAVALNGTAKQIYSGSDHICVVLAEGSVRCWGANAGCQLGIVFDPSKNLGDDEEPFTAPTVLFGGGNVTSMALGQDTTCALIDDGGVRCWGLGGTLGSETLVSRGCAPGEMPPPDDVEAGADAAEITAGAQHTCVRLVDGTVRCWGYTTTGAQGNGTDQGIVGDMMGEMPPDFVKIDGTPVGIASGAIHNCVILEGDRLKCWGGNYSGALGYGHTMHIGDQPLEMPPIDVPLFE